MALGIGFGIVGYQSEFLDIRNRQSFGFDNQLPHVTVIVPLEWIYKLYVRMILSILFEQQPDKQHPEFFALFPIQGLQVVVALEKRIHTKSQVRRFGNFIQACQTIVLIVINVRILQFVVVDGIVIRHAVLFRVENRKRRFPKSTVQISM